ncbi:DUF3953 domain-containing protein [Jeotgalibacillus salarius]|uniref:DUF3953 domain-containing protein n=1 Tax=Jeotgalibacillus salarius TaxID=546023 RepID=A0A4Y8LDF0_9BACL|nr:DUF3953 domain-containing protein [Jeotgalibacillus salarius]TFE00492.1 DUF3953 domain-containing protein [Jeotgalibacillus salarius]
MRILIKVLLSALVIAVAGYSFLTGDRTVIPLYMFPLALLLLMTGIENLKDNKTFYGVISIIVSAFVFFVAGYISLAA